MLVFGREAQESWFGLFVWFSSCIWSLLLILAKQHCNDTKMGPPTKRQCPFDYDDNFGELEPVVEGELINPGAAAVNCLEPSLKIVKTEIAKIEKAMHALDNFEGHLTREKDVALANVSEKCKVVAAKEKEVVACKKQTAMLTERLAAKDTEIKELKETVAKKDSEIKKLEKQLSSVSIKTIDGVEELLGDMRKRIVSKSKTDA
jgi:predicted  nucleic acid-binding Zn-ribbon protein